MLLIFKRNLKCYVYYIIIRLLSSPIRRLKGVFVKILTSFEILRSLLTIERISINLFRLVSRKSKKKRGLIIRERFAAAYTILQG